MPLKDYALMPNGEIHLNEYDYQDMFNSPVRPSHPHPPLKERKYTPYPTPANQRPGSVATYFTTGPNRETQQQQMYYYEDQPHGLPSPAPTSSPRSPYPESPRITTTTTPRSRYPTPAPSLSRRSSTTRTTSSPSMSHTFSPPPSTQANLEILYELGLPRTASPYPSSPYTGSPSPVPNTPSPGPSSMPGSRRGSSTTTSNHRSPTPFYPNLDTPSPSPED